METEPFATWDMGATWTSIYATPDDGTSIDYNNNGIKSIFILVEDGHINTGTWGPGNGGVSYYDGQALYDSGSNDFSITVTTSNYALGTVKGTFFATVDDGGGNSLDITNGRFRVKRIAP